MFKLLIVKRLILVLVVVRLGSSLWYGVRYKSPLANWASKKNFMRADYRKENVLLVPSTPEAHNFCSNGPEGHTCSFFFCVLTPSCGSDYQILAKTALVTFHFFHLHFSSPCLMFKRAQSPIRS